MTTRRRFLTYTGAGIAFAAVPSAFAQAAKPLVKVYKSPACGCCGEWEKHMKANGFQLETHAVNDVTPIKAKWGVPEAMYSCHTALVGGYVLEGHVPAADVRRLLSERPTATGLAVPGMVVGSPGMEQGTPQPYATMAFNAQRSWVFAQH